MFSFNITNVTDFFVKFSIGDSDTNVGTYVTKHPSAVMPPGSTQRIVVEMTPEKKELEDEQYKDTLNIYSSLGKEGVEASDFVDRIYYEVGKVLPIVLKKVISLIMQ
jgi:hypothetical protein